ncbi:MAG: heavy metal translocating P-type ATPase [Halobacteriales archaeon]
MARSKGTAEKQGEDGCTLCDLPVEEPVKSDNVDGVFCCRGCMEVHRTLGDVEIDEAGEDDGTYEVPDGAEEAFLSVEGMHCSACEVFIESRAEEREGVENVEASYASELVKMVYDPDAVGREDLVEAVDGFGYRAYDPEEGDERDDELAELLTVGRLVVGAWLGMMVMVWYIVFLYPEYLGLSALVERPGPLLDSFTSYYLVLGTTVVLFVTGYPILRSAYVSLRSGTPNMDLLVSLAAVNAYVYSIGVLLVGGTEVYFDITVVIIMVVTLGNYYEKRIKRRAADRMEELTRERVDEARRRTDGGDEVVSVEELREGDEVVVRPGERVPVDGTVVEGSAAVDESLLTGESLPETKAPGDDVIGGSVVTDDALVVEVPDEKVSTFDRLVNFLWDVQSSRPGVQRLADRLAGVFVPLVLLIAGATFGVRAYLTGNPGDAMLSALAVLVVSCPCALGLATPLAVASGVREALEDGVAITDGSVFEDTQEYDVVAFDKTGTLTTGDMRVVDTVAAESEDTDCVLERAAAVERYSSHPIAEAVTEQVPDTPEATGFTRHPGKGVSANVEDGRVVVGSSTLVDELGMEVPADLADAAERERQTGNAPVYVGWDGEVRGVVIVGDRPRDEWEQTVEALDARIAVITGDDEAAAGYFRKHDEVDDVFAGVPPEAKAETVERLRGHGKTVMVGDGTNDAPALAAADLGVALGTGTATAGDAADIVVTHDDLTKVVDVLGLTRSTKRRIRQNLGWALTYNAVAVPAAVAGVISPAVAAFAMATSSVLVVANSSRGF